MKKVIAFFLLLTITISPIFRGLFYTFETAVFFAAISFLLCVYFFVKLINKEDLHFSRWLFIFCLILITAVGLSFLNAVNVRKNIELLLQYGLYLLLTIVLYDYSRDKKQSFFSLFSALVVIVGFVCAIIGLEELTGVFVIMEEAFNRARLGSTFIYANTAAIYFSICIIFALTIINTSKMLFAQIMLIGIGNIILLGFFSTVSRGGCIIGSFFILLYIILQPAGQKLKTLIYSVCMTYPLLWTLKGFSDSASASNHLLSNKWLIISFILALFAGLCFILIQKIKFKAISPLFKKSILIIACIGCILLVYTFRDKLGGLIPEKMFNRLTLINLDDNNFFARMSFNRWAVELIQDSWLIGYGGGGFASLYQSVSDTYFVVKDVHNHYLQVFVENGILGFLPFAGIIVITFFRMIIAMVKTTESKMKSIIAGSLCAFSALAVHSVMDFNLTFQSIGLLFWVLIAAGSVFYAASKQNRGVFKVKGKVVLIISGLILLSCNFIVMIASYNAYRGEQYMKSENYELSLKHYRDADKWDPINSEYSYELAKLCNYFGNSADDSSIADTWSDKAIKYAKRSVANNQYDPFRIEILTVTYFDAGMPIEAYETAEKQVKYQRCGVKAYDLLAKGYIEAAIQNMRNQDIEFAKNLLGKCANLENTPYVELSKEALFYKAEAMMLLGNNNGAEEILLSIKKFQDADILLYIVYEMAESEEKIQQKYSREAIDTIQKSMLYTNVSAIISSGVLH